MSSSLLNPHLIRFGVIGLVFVGRAIAAANRKRQAQNRQLQPPQSGPLSSSLDAGPPPASPQDKSSLSPQSRSPLSPPAPPSMSSLPQRKPKAPDSPWSDLK